MDVPLEKSQSVLNKNKFVAGGAVLVVFFFAWMLIFSDADTKVNSDKITIGEVKEGQFEISVDGFGVLRSREQNLLTALTDANVKKISLRPGADLNEEDVILVMTNPEVNENFETARIALAQGRAALQKLSLMNQREILAEKEKLADTKAKLELTKLHRVAEGKLVKDGIIPQIQFETTVLKERTVSEKLIILKEKIKQLNELNLQSVIIQEEEINHLQSQVDNAQRRVDALIVKSNGTGTLQRLFVELGQSVVAGQELALVGGNSDLTAIVNISQSKAQHIKNGQSAVVRFGTTGVEGTVIRVVPEVRDGTVEVEIGFADALPATARPELSISATIFVKSISNALFVQRPANIREGSEAELFKLDKNGKEATKVKVQFGEESGQEIRIVSGLLAKEQLILSDMRKYSELNNVKILN